MNITNGKQALGVQKGNRVEYILSGKKYTGTIVKAPSSFSFEAEAEIQPDNLDVLHTVPIRNVRRLSKPKRVRQYEYAIRKVLGL
jgi:hypothetical protein